MLAGLLQC